MKIREPRLVDIPVWSEMRAELWPDPEDMNALELNGYFSGQSIDIKQAFMAEVEGQVIGFIELNIRNCAEGSRNAEVPYIEAWYVHEDFQGKGYGRQLIKRAENWALDSGFTELASDTQFVNERSICAHKHLGFIETDRIVCFLKQLN